MFGLGEGVYPALTGISSQLRLKDAEFPAFGGKPHPKPQPSLMLHAGMNVNSPFVPSILTAAIDVTPEASKSIIGDLYGDHAARITNSRFQVITSVSSLL